MRGRPAAFEWRPLLLAALLAAVSTGGYLLAARWAGFSGFPLDDAWIHQTFARNLAETGQWAFVVGHPSAGSTSISWTLLMAAGDLLGLGPRLWAYLCGWATLAATAWLAGRLMGRLGGGRASQWVATALVALEWHLAWASASGMETLLFAGLVLLTFDLSLRDPAESGEGRQWLAVGLAAGAASLTRPDGLTLLPFALAPLLLAAPRAGLRRTLVAAAWFGAGCGVLLAANLAFNFQLSGQLWPNTFYAKQAEYAVLRQEPLAGRLLRIGVLPLVGAVSVLVPGLGLSAYHSVRERRWERLAPLAWALGFLGLYAVRLPVVYQHGRYVMPAIPVLAVVGVEGLGRWLRLRGPNFTRRVVSRAWAVSLAAVLAAFWLRGAQAYAEDVAFIETEMVAAAQWLQANAPPQALVAAHDIGAVGYFARRPLLDLAGLVSPEIIPILRDEPALADYMVSAHAAYLVTFPGWYPTISADPRFVAVFSTGGRHSQAPSGENMVIYRVAPESARVLYSSQYSLFAPNPARKMAQTAVEGRSIQ